MRHVSLLLQCEDNRCVLISHGKDPALYKSLWGISFIKQDICMDVSAELWVTGLHGCGLYHWLKIFLGHMEKLYFNVHINLQYIKKSKGKEEKLRFVCAHLCQTKPWKLTCTCGGLCRFKAFLCQNEHEMHTTSAVSLLQPQRKHVYLKNKQAPMQANQLVLQEKENVFTLCR